MKVYCIKIQFVGETSDTEFYFERFKQGRVVISGCARFSKLYTSLPAVLKSMDKIKSVYKAANKNVNIFLVCYDVTTAYPFEECRIAPITQEDLGDLDFGQLENLYGDFLTKSQKKQLDKIFNGENNTDEDFIQAYFDAVYDRLNELDLFI